MQYTNWKHLRRSHGHRLTALPDFSKSLKIQSFCSHRRRYYLVIFKVTLLCFLEFTLLLIKLNQEITSATDTKKFCPFLMLQQHLMHPQAGISSLAQPFSRCAGRMLRFTFQEPAEASSIVNFWAEHKALQSCRGQLLLPRLPFPPPGHSCTT